MKAFIESTQACKQTELQEHLFKAKIAETY